MFRKSFRTKCNTRLKTSDKKKLRNEIINQFPLLSDNKSLDILNLKSNVSLMEIITHSGDIVSVFTLPKYPCFIYINGIYFPTVFIMWECPQLLHNFKINAFVFEKIQGGADLMLPGIILEEPVVTESFGALKKGDPVGINLTDSLDTIAVGEAYMSSEDMFLSGGKGKCIRIIHYHGDKLAELAPNVVKPNSVIITDLLKPELELSGVETQDKDLDNTIVNVEIISSESDLSQKLSDQHVGDDFIETLSDPSHQDSMENMLMFCFFKSVVTSVKKVQLPLLTNVFYKVHMREVYPVGSSIDIKKSKYKKLSTFLDSMAQLGVITIEGNSVGVHKIISIDYSHHMIRDFLKAHPTESIDKKSSQDSLNLGPNISEKHTINAAVLPLFSKFSYKKGDLVTQADVRKAITSYVKTEQLQDETDRRFVFLDPLLAGMLKKDVMSVTWEDLMKACIDLMGQSFQVNISSNKTITGKGKLSPIDIQVSTRSGNKKVTLINNLGFYGINLQEFAKECQHGVAASTTINSLPHLKCDQVQVQGSQVNFIGKILTEKYKVPKKYIRGWVPK